MAKKNTVFVINLLVAAISWREVNYFLIFAQSHSQIQFVYFDNIRDEPF